MRRIFCVICTKNIGVFMRQRVSPKTENVKEYYFANWW